MSANSSYLQGLLPAEVVAYNYWTGFQSEEPGKLFESLSYEDAAELKGGETLWLDTEPPCGRVDSFSRVSVVSVTVSDSAVRIDYRGPFSEGNTFVPKEKKNHDVNRCVDDRALIQFVIMNPLAREPGTVGTMSDESALYLKTHRARLVAAD